MIPQFCVLRVIKHGPLSEMTKSKMVNFSWSFIRWCIVMHHSLHCAHLHLAVSLCALKCAHILMALLRYKTFRGENSPARVKVKSRTRYYIEQQCFYFFIYLFIYLFIWPECKHFSMRRGLSTLEVHALLEQLYSCISGNDSNEEHFFCW